MAALACSDRHWHSPNKRIGKCANFPFSSLKIKSANKMCDSFSLSHSVWRGSLEMRILIFVFKIKGKTPIKIACCSEIQWAKFVVFIFAIMNWCILHVTSDCVMQKCCFGAHKRSHLFISIILIWPNIVDSLSIHLFCWKWRNWRSVHPKSFHSN